MHKQASYIVLFSKTDFSMAGCWTHTTATHQLWQLQPHQRLEKILPYHNWPASNPSRTKTDCQYLTESLLPMFCIDHKYLIPLLFTSRRSQVSTYSPHQENQEGLSLLLEPAKKLLSPYVTHGPCWAKEPLSAKQISDLCWFCFKWQFWTVSPLDCWSPCSLEERTIWGVFSKSHQHLSSHWFNPEEIQIPLLLHYLRFKTLKLVGAGVDSIPIPEVTTLNRGRQ